MNEIGIVQKLEANKALICIEENIPAGGGCNGNCITCGKNTSSRNIWAKYTNDKSLQISDKVEIYYPPGKTIKAAFLVFILPLLLFFLFYYLCQILFKVQDDLIAGLAGLGGLAAGILFNIVLYRLNKNSQLPEIIRKIS